jgi:hypothetical protein
MKTIQIVKNTNEPIVLIFIDHIEAIFNENGKAIIHLSSGKIIETTTMYEDISSLVSQS